MASLNNPDDLKLRVLGQVAVVRDRLNRLEQALLVPPREFEPADVSDAIGNVSFQTGILVGTLTDYVDAIGAG